MMKIDRVEVENFSLQLLNMIYLASRRNESIPAYEIADMIENFIEDNQKSNVCKGCGGAGTVLVLDFDADEPIQPCPICKGKK